MNNTVEYIIDIYAKWSLDREGRLRITNHLEVLSHIVDAVPNGNPILLYKEAVINRVDRLTHNQISALNDETYPKMWWSKNS